MDLDTWGVRVVGASRSLGPFLCLVDDQGMVLMEECFMLLENMRCFYFVVASLGGRMADFFSRTAVLMLVSAREDGRKLAYLFFSDLYKLFLILLLCTPVSFTIINLI